MKYVSFPECVLLISSLLLGHSLGQNGLGLKTNHYSDYISISIDNKMHNRVYKKVSNCKNARSQCNITQS